MKLYEGSIGMMTRSVLLMAFALLAVHALGAHAAFAVVRNVPAAYPTIQAAIDASTTDDEVVVSPGTYVENIDFKGRRIVVRSTDPDTQSVVDATVIDGNRLGPVVRFAGTENDRAVLRGFTLKNGKATASSGGGIQGNYATATIQKNVIKNCLAEASGGGIFQINGLIEFNTISGNVAHRSGGGLADCQLGVIRNNRIEGNVASAIDAESPFDEGGGGLYNCGASIIDNIIRNNTSIGYTPKTSTQRGSYSRSGGGLWQCNGPGEIRGNTITGNSSNKGGGLAQCGATIINNVIANNRAYDNRNKRQLGNGGGAYGCDGDFVNNLVYSNTSDLAGGGLSTCWGNVANCVIAKNKSLYDGGGGIFNTVQNKGTVTNCIVWANTAASGAAYAQKQQISNVGGLSYSCVQNYVATSASIKGMISDDPQFVNLTGNDFRLQATSPCLDRGIGFDAASGLDFLRYDDFEGNPRGVRGAAGATTWKDADGLLCDMGAFERTSPVTAAKFALVQKVTRSTVNAIYTSEVTDRNADGFIDVSDMVVALKN